MSAGHVRARRAAERCALPGFPQRRWSPSSGSGYFMGRLPIYGERPDEYPPETHEDGCPGAWYRSRFVRSLIPYERTASGDGVLSENLRLSRCDDLLVLDAVQYLETERARARAHWREHAR